MYSIANQLHIFKQTIAQSIAVENFIRILTKFNKKFINN